MKQIIQKVFILCMIIAFTSCDDDSNFIDFKSLTTDVVIPESVDYLDTLELISPNLPSDKIDDGNHILFIRINQILISTDSLEVGTFNNLKFLDIYIANEETKVKIGWLENLSKHNTDKVELKINNNAGITSIFDGSHFHFVLKTQLKEPVEASWTLRVKSTFKIERYDPLMFM